MCKAQPNFFTCLIETKKNLSGVRRVCLSFVVPSRSCRHGKIQTGKFLATSISWCLCTAGVVIAWMLTAVQQLIFWLLRDLAYVTVLLPSALEVNYPNCHTAGEGPEPLGSALPAVIQLRWPLNPVAWRGQGTPVYSVWGCNDLAIHIRNIAKAFPRHWEKL